MRFRVVRMRSRGARRPGTLLRADPGLEGELLLEHVPLVAGATIGQAVLKDTTGAFHATLMPPLRRPVLASAGPNGFVLAGTEVDPKGAAEYVQEWWCRPPGL